MWKKSNLNLDKGMPCDAVPLKQQIYEAVNF